ncbi:response regulator [Primorskyibacter sp. S87]|uniref:response regulator n=1 Tax=Primorskyibacter sp. S87 TaxID=3415126 RepID=UPI003C7C2490
MSRFRGHVFVVDDDSSFLAAICRLIRVGGFEATGVVRLSDLYAYLPFPEESCVLADIILDGESGLEIPSVLFDRGEPAPVIFMSATDDVETLVAADHAGSARCLRKPFEADELFHSLTAVLPEPGQATDPNAYANEDSR